MPSASSSPAASTELRAEDWRNGGFGLYVHWPFCESKCPYCDFNSHVARFIDHDRWEAAYLLELERYAALTPGRVLDSIFFGGGTPSLMRPETVGRVIEKARALWPASNTMEVTLEANPSSVEAGRFAGFSDAGVNRISMGIQSLNDDDLRALGRLHSVAEARAAFDIARDRFDRVSFDLIYARQGQSVEAWRAELREALSMAVDHLSLYQLTIEEGTAFGDRHERGLLRGLPEDDDAAEMYFATQEICDAAGLPAYEVSNHAGEGAESRHNLIYWRYGDYLGIGPGAHGRITLGGQRHAVENPRAPGAWLDRVGQGDPASWEPLAPEETATEFLMMGLRLREGIDPARYEALAGEPIDPAGLAYVADLGMIEQEQGRLRVSEQGRPVLNAVIRELLAR